MSNLEIEDMDEFKHHPAKLLALKMIAQFKWPRIILRELAPYVQEGIITRSWLEKQSSEAKRAKCCKPIVCEYRRKQFAQRNSLKTWCLFHQLLVVTQQLLIRKGIRCVILPYEVETGKS